MLKNKTPEEYIALLEELEQFSDRDHAFLKRVQVKADAALSTGNVVSFIRIMDLFDEPGSREILSHSSELMKVRYLLTAVSHEYTVGLPLFINHADSYDSLLDLYDYITLLLRRVEFELDDLMTDALSTLRKMQISSFSISAILYNMVSHLGHRERILETLANDALEHGLLVEAYGFLNVVEHPSGDVISMKQELFQLIRGNQT